MPGRITVFGLILTGAAALLFTFFSLSYYDSYDKVTYHLAEGVLPEVSAESWVLFDAETGEILLEHNSDEVFPIASITKLMTAETALQSYDLSTSTLITWRVVNTEGRSGKLSAGELIDLYELLFPLLLESSNDAAEAIASHFGSEAFIVSMNTRADELDMPATTFVDPSGLSAGNVATSRDISKLMSHLMHHNRHVLDITRLTKFIGTNHAWLNNNPVFSSGRYLGGKHGFTDEAGRTLAAVFDETLNGNEVRSIGVVLLDSDDLPLDTEVLRAFTRAHITYR